jgi:hypothetical protein
VTRKKSTAQKAARLDTERSAVQIAADGLEMLARFSSADMDDLQGELLERCEQRKKSSRTNSWALAQRAFVKLQQLLDACGAKSMKHVTSRSVAQELTQFVREIAQAGDDPSAYFARVDATSVGLRRLRRSMEASRSAGTSTLSQTADTPK